MKKTVCTVVACALAGAAVCASMAMADQSVTAESVQLTEADIETYCCMCHFKNVENQGMNTWNNTNIDFGMVESMVPMLDDATIQGIVDYYADVEPAAEE